MSTIELAKAVRNAEEIEASSARFYRELAARGTDERARALLHELAAEEAQHVLQVAEIGRRLGAGELPESADELCETVETSPAWTEVEEITTIEALVIALEAETNSALYYDALAGAAGAAGALGQFFSTMKHAEERHADRIEALLRELTAAVAAT